MKLRTTVKLLTVLILAASLVSLWSCKKDGDSGKGVPFYDNEGSVICRLETADTSKWKLKDKELEFYIRYSVDEALKLIADTDKCTEEEAEKKLFGSDLAVYTNFDRSAFEGLKAAYVENAADVDYSYGGAVSDITGNLLALYSKAVSDESNVDYSTAKQKVYGVLNPIGVYAPVLESKQLDWSSIVSSTDSVMLFDNVKSQDAEVEEDILSEYGIQNSLDFLKERFNVELSLENDADSAEKFVKGDFSEKYSPLQLVRVYQFMANGGYIYELKSVNDICDSKGNIIYHSESVFNKVTERYTADILNKLLQGAIVHGSKDSGAYCDNLSAGGRSGSGKDGSCFVGFTPQYVCAVWHGNELSYNSAPDLFSLAVSHFEHDYSLDYPTAQSVKAVLYCTETGARASDGCKKTGLGYYEQTCLPDICNKH